MPRTLAAMPTAAPQPEVHDLPPEAEPTAGPLEVIYPRYVTRIHAIGGDKPPIDEEFIDALLGWETEEEFAARMLLRHPEAERKLHSYGFGDSYDLKDMEGKKVKLWNNQGNRDFVRDHAMKLSQDLLTRNWADSRNGGTIECLYRDPEHPDDTLPDVEMPDGTTLKHGDPVTLPEMTINGETIIVTRTGRVDSGQHRGIMFKFCCQLYRLDPEKWRRYWPDGPPTMEALIFYGVSDSDRVTQTLDNVMPRDQTATIATGHDFRDHPKSERQELCRMLALATDLLWRRTGVDLYQTHSASRAFRERHPSLAKFVLHTFEENKERPISKLRLSPAMVSGLAYLMAASATDEDRYFAEDQNSRTEDLINFTKKVEVDGKKKAAWDAAGLFVTMLAASGATEGADLTLAAIGEKLLEISTATGTKASSAEQAAILSIAWNVFSGGGKLSKDDLDLTDLYGHREDGSRFVKDHPNVGGIDLGVKSRDESGGDEPTPEEIKAAEKEKADQIKKENAARQKALVKQAQEERAKKEGGTTTPLAEEAAKAAERVRLIAEAAARRKAANGQPAAVATPAPTATPVTKAPPATTGQKPTKPTAGKQVARK